MIRVVLIDNHRLFRVSLKILLKTFGNCEVVLDVSSLKEIPNGFDKRTVHIVIVDPNDYDSKSFEKVKKYFSLSKVIILTNTSDSERVLDFMQMGISGFFSKKDCPQQLESAITSIAASYSFEEVRLGAEVRQLLIDDVGTRQTKKVNFTEREIQILNLVCLEKTNAEISTILGLSIRTVESHRRRMIDKADCRSIIGVILNALSLKSLNLKLPTGNSSQAS